MGKNKIPEKYSLRSLELVFEFHLNGTEKWPFILFTNVKTFINYVKYINDILMTISENNCKDDFY